MEKRGSQLRKKSFKKGIREGLAKAWTVSVINPILEGLENEVLLLRQKDWSWRFTTGSLEYISPIPGYIDIRHYANYELFCKEYTHIERSFQHHDNLIYELVVNLNSLSNTFLNREKFNREFFSLEEESKKIGLDLKGSWGALLEEEKQKRKLIEYILNSTKKLPSYYTTSKLWDAFGERFLKLKDESEIKPLVERVEIKGSELLKTTEEIINRLKTLREDYAKSFGIPPIPVGESVG